ncbi:hypothetical protein AVEN_106306-1 [Araneus ventricosus]|uniref:Uncharacterized protein n=1 Tax=Araneus ventricosus TaxID=182803 RepID=A0A4Y2AS17_ARAVE|nr:hypothetical protein AVEN_106306-1 [Araneus ventricosus]
MFGKPQACKNMIRCGLFCSTVWADLKTLRIIRKSQTSDMPTKEATKESQPRQVESEWVEQAEAAQILPNQNEAALVADQRAGFKFNWEERGFKRFSVSNLSQRTGREACQLHLVNILLDLFSAG